MFDRDESKDFELTPELAALERQLAGLDAAPLQLNRDWLMFEAGRAAGRTDRDLAATLRVAGAPRWFWPSAAAMLTAACVVLAAMLIWPEGSALVTQRDAMLRATTLPELGAPASQDRSQVERLAERAPPLYQSIRPVGGYLEQRYIALTGAIGDTRFNGGGATTPSTDAAQPATARDLLRDLLPPIAPSPSRS